MKGEGGEMEAREVMTGEGGECEGCVVEGGNEVTRWKGWMG